MQQITRRMRPLQRGKPDSNLRKRFNAGLRYIALYMRSSTFHGMNQVAASTNGHWTEVLFWVSILIAFGFGAVWNIIQSYQRYSANPTVITLDKSYRMWNITFPATTFCFADKFDDEKAKILIKRKWNQENGTRFDYYMKFLRVVANSSYHNLPSFEEFQDDRSLAKENLYSLMNEVNFDMKYFSPTLFSKKLSYFFKVLLEMGICYSVSSLVAREFATRNNSRDLMFGETAFGEYEPDYCVYSNLVCYGMVEDLPREAIVYVHSPYEVPIAASPHHKLYFGYHMELAYNQFEIKASSNVRKLRPNQRRCFFLDEPGEQSARYYSVNTCLMHCRRLLALEWCNCVPHFYKAEAGQPVCNIQQLSCIHRRASQLLALSLKTTDKSCMCYPTCEGTYVVFDYETISNHDIQVAQEVIISTRYRWAVEKYSKTRYRRDIIFGVEELIVSFGGTACFFLGGSLMSGIELIYFFSVRFIRYLK